MVLFPHTHWLYQTTNEESKFWRYDKLTTLRNLNRSKASDPREKKHTFTYLTRAQDFLDS